MDINRLLGGLIRPQETVDPKLLELRIGQVVRGVVLQMLADREAIVSISGVPVRAKLDAPLRQGQVTLMQVQPESEPGTILFKTLQASKVPIPESSLGEVVRTFGLPDTEMNRMLLRDLHAAGIKLDKPTIAMFMRAMETMPAPSGPTNAAAEQWLSAAIVAYKKELPLSPELIAPLRQALHGPPIGRLVAALQDALAMHSDVDKTQARTATGEASVRQAVVLLQEAVSRWTQITASLQAALLGADKTGEAAAQPASERVGTAQLAPLPLPAQPGVNQPQGGQLASTQQPAEPQAPVAASPQSHLSPQQHSSVAEARPAQANEPKTNSPSPLLGQQIAEREPAPGGAVVRTDTDTIPNEGRLPAHREDTWIKALLRHLGMDYERRAYQQLGAQAAVEPEVLESMKETMKGVVLQILSDPAAPPALKETAQQLLQHITGLQLLLAADRNAPYTLMTMMIPVGGSEHPDEQATVQIQARKRKGGQIDADNCRLIFDLQMKSMGDTLIDVQVVSRVVSLQVHNNHPIIGEMLAASRSEIEAALTGLGFQFISMKQLPYPDRQTASRQSLADEQLPAAVNPYHAKPYKGVDLRV